MSAPRRRLEQHLTDPDRLDVEREPNEHPAFAFDRHFCLGAHLARVEAQLAFSTLLRRFSGLGPGSFRLEWTSNTACGGFKGVAGDATEISIKFYPKGNERDGPEPWRVSG
jgi:cytochrome P450